MAMKQGASSLLTTAHKASAQAPSLSEIQRERVTTRDGEALRLAKKVLGLLIKMSRSSPVVLNWGDER